MEWSLRTVAGVVAALIMAALVVLPALRALQLAWMAHRAVGVASATTVTACQESGGRWAATMCLYDGGDRTRDAAGARAPARAGS
jgi:hypothetical protein